jgi:ADP-ribosylglycohydrolase
VTHLLHWAKNEELFGKFAGPTTRRAIQKLREGVNPNEAGFPINMLDMVTNGAAMKVAPIGLAHPGDLDAAVRDATTMCIPTHNTDVAYSGAAAVAAAIATAVVPGATQLSVVDAAIYGAKQGYQVGRKRAAIIPSPSVVERIRMAVEIAAGQSDFDVISKRLAEIIGCGLSIIETVPVAIGLFVAARGDANQALFGAVNLGGDADTVATITGVIAGAFSGIDQIDPGLVSTIERVNHIELAQYARQLVDLN